MLIRRANAGDLEPLVEMRLEFLEGMPEMTPEKAGPLRQASHDFFHQSLSSGDTVLLVAEEAGVLCCTGMLMAHPCPPSYRTPIGRCATIYGVYTPPPCRGRGYARALVGELVAAARGLGAEVVNLMATEAGAPLYRKLGFLPSGEAPMALNLQEDGEPPVSPLSEADK